MDQSYDVIVVGLGAMGSAAAFHLARRGYRVLGLDRFHPPHILGSSHGETRLIREAYFENQAYVPIVQRAYELWEQLEDYAGKTLWSRTGGLMIGPPQGDLVTGAEYSARHHHLPYERLSGFEARRRFPAFHVPDSMIAIWDPRAGMLFPEACVESHLGAARKFGAELHYDERLTSWRPDGVGAVVVTERGRYAADRVVLTAGAWVKGLLPDLPLPLTVERQVLFWFEPAARPEVFEPEGCPVFIWEDESERYYYGTPDIGSGVKVARMHHGQITGPDSVKREVTPGDAEPVRAFLARYMPNANGGLLNAQVCLFTNTPDLNFIIDFHPAYPQVLIASPCSGHGFKFASAIGEILADLVTEGESYFDLDLFKIERFASYL